MDSGVSQHVLALDTSGSFCSVALRRGDGAVYHRESEGAGDHFERLPQLVRDVLRESRVDAPQIHEVRIGIGPGSFTGLRIGMSFAKGFVSVRTVPLVGVSSFLGLATAAAHVEQRGNEKDIVVVSDARRNEVFIAVYRKHGNNVEEIQAPHIRGVDEVVALRGPSGAEGLFTPLVDFALPSGARPQVVSRIAEGLLRVETVMPLAADPRNVAELEPNYLRAVAAKSIAERRGA